MKHSMAPLPDCAAPEAAQALAIKPLADTLLTGTSLATTNLPADGRSVRDRLVLLTPRVEMTDKAHPILL
jgi:hypothetical protein